MTPSITPEAIAGVIIIGAGLSFVAWQIAQLIRGK